MNVDEDNEIVDILSNDNHVNMNVNDQSRGRVNPVQQQLRREQPQPGPFQQNNWTPNMPSNGGQKKKRTKNYSKKYNNKNYKNKNYKNKKRQRQTRRSRKI